MVFQGRGTIGRNMPRLEDLDNDLIYAACTQLAGFERESNIDVA